MIQNLLFYHSDHLCGTAIHFLMFLHNYCHALLDYMYRLYLLHPRLGFFFSLMQSVSGIQLLNISSFSHFVCISLCFTCSCSSDCYGFFHKHVSFNVVTKNWIVLYHRTLEFASTICVICSTFIIIHLSLIFFLKLDGWLFMFSSKFMIFF